MTEQDQKIIELYQNGLSGVKIAKQLNITNGVVYSCLERHKISRRSNKINSIKYSVNHDYFEVIDTEEKAYWLGFMYADGFVTCRNNVGLSLGEKDYNHLVKFKNCLQATNPIKKYTVSNGFTEGSIYYRLLITSDKMKQDLIKHGCVEQKTDILTAPNINKNLQKHFIRGYIDGDGCITRSLIDNRYQYKIKICGTDAILQYIADFIQENNIATIHKFYKRKEGQTVSYIDFGGNIQVIKFLNLVYGNSNIYLDRKYNIYLEACEQIKNI